MIEPSTHLVLKARGFRKVRTYVGPANLIEFNVIMPNNAISGFPSWILQIPLGARESISPTRSFLGKGFYCCMFFRCKDVFPLVRSFVAKMFSHLARGTYKLADSQKDDSFEKRQVLDFSRVLGDWTKMMRGQKIDIVRARPLLCWVILRLLPKK